MAERCHGGPGGDVAAVEPWMEDVDELCAKLGRSRDIILKLLSRGV
eukprot:CAMPEP_0203956150 /NCGR_PEP_ID=MMETSP0359-20131031/88528_1 /ASSEMBLY_ACC=CAM_ASM_000338 /TAXON_ID=268821 /ORGANISM="Scrippsiella Hangoei, Strain SHTV-5" /LENGTH=45 /DNA_ID= /DNA_START= /DNA_END= /DNA_ORIENTATION=